MAVLYQHLLFFLKQIPRGMRMITNFVMLDNMNQDVFAANQNVHMAQVNESYSINFEKLYL